MDLKVETSLPADKVPGDAVNQLISAVAKEFPEVPVHDIIATLYYNVGDIAIGGGAEGATELCFKATLSSGRWVRAYPSSTRVGPCSGPEEIKRLLVLHDKIDAMFGKDNKKFDGIGGYWKTLSMAGGMSFLDNGSGCPALYKVTGRTLDHLGRCTK